MRWENVLVIFLLVIIGGFLVYLLGESTALWQQVPLVIPLVSPIPSPAVKTEGNPASIYCTQVGGTLTIQKDTVGQEVGICTFSDGSFCKEEDLYAGTCKPGER
jgi:putative hemolysin